MKKIILALLLFAITGAASAQTTGAEFIQKNTFDGIDLTLYRAVTSSKDSTYTTSFDYTPGKTASLSRKGKVVTVITPDGVHYVITLSGPTAILVAPDSSKTLWIDRAPKTTIIHPNGTQSVFITTITKDYRSTEVTNPDGSTFTVKDNLKGTLIVNADGTHSYSFKTGPNTTLIVNADGSQKTITTP
ncbi:hypothetical protein SAMN05216464_11990 [Mucilaginibacter pineti]|uniref:Uncharacterized protein n=1 Tax=Mucilaginibacter pineti TaxID=1391627 RepID=A0A1G7LTZ5_9SPHI|nr:hypothetical protein [Mucilaginibacter pineti]SDF52439.1 hypothetical protein SAMN05216464_11990 [Mucilaginibacter pineti]